MKERGGRGGSLTDCNGRVGYGPLIVSRAKITGMDMIYTGLVKGSMFTLSGNLFPYSKKSLKTPSRIDY